MTLRELMAVLDQWMPEYADKIVIDDDFNEIARVDGPLKPTPGGSKEEAALLDTVSIVFKSGRFGRKP